MRAEQAGPQLGRREREMISEEEPMKILPERCPGCDCIAHPDPCSSTGCDCHVELWSPNRFRNGVILVKGLGRLARFTTVGMIRGYGFRESVFLAQEVERVISYAAALGYTPDDVNYFMDRGLNWEETKFRMTLGERPWEDSHG